MTVAAWCTEEQVQTAMKDEEVPDALLTTYAQIASDVMFDITGGQWYQPATVSDIVLLADGGGRLLLGDWQPIKEITIVSRDDNPSHGVMCPVERALEPWYENEAQWTTVDPTLWRLSRGRTYVQVSSCYAHRLHSVTLVRGRGLPRHADTMTALLAAEMLKRDPMYLGGQESVLPKNVTSVSRQGVTFSFEAAKDVLGEGRVGVFTVDLWLRSVNKGQQTTPARVRRRVG